MSLRHKLLVVFGGLAAIALIVAGLTLWITMRWDETSRGMEAHYQRSLLLQRVRAATFQAIKEVSDRALLGDKDAEEEFKEAIKPARKDLEDWSELADTDDEEEEIKRVEQAFNRLVAVAEQAFALIKNGDSSAAAFIEERLEKEAYAAFRETSEAAVERDRSRREDIRETVQDVQSTAYAILSVAAVGTISLVLLLAAYLASDLFRPLRSVEHALDDVTRGGLQTRLDENREDEIGRIHRAFNRMVATLEERARLMGRAAMPGDEVQPDGSGGWRDMPSRVTLHAMIAKLRSRIVNLKASADGKGKELQPALRQVDDLLAAVTRLAEFGFPLDLNLARTDLRTLVYDVLSGFQDQIARRSASCEVSLDPSVDEVVLDRPKLREAIGETIRNALAALPERGGRIGLRTLREDGLVAIEVADNGRGMDPADLGRLLDYDPFKADGRPKVGLALTKAVAEQHGGRLEVFSRPEVGTVVRLELPQRS
jgi:two-component system, OmpR family, sensor kinase